MTAIYQNRNDITPFTNSFFKLCDAVLCVDNATKKDVRHALMNEKDTIIIIGHGTPKGFLWSDFDSPKSKHNSLCINSDDVQFLRGKTIIGIWCYAKEFALKYELEGFFTDMFISTIWECGEHGYDAGENWEENINGENKLFSERVAELISNKVPMEEWVERLRSMADYSKEFVAFNYDGLVYLKY